MAITNGTDFRKWAKDMAKLSGSELRTILNLLSRRENADEIIKMAVDNNWTKDVMMSFLAPASPVPAPAQTQPDPTLTREQQHEQLRAQAAASSSKVIESAGEIQPQPKVVGEQKPKFFARAWNWVKSLMFKDKAEAAPQEAKPAKKPMSKKTMLIIGGVAVVVLLVLGFVGYNMFAGGGGVAYDLGNDPLGGPSGINEAPATPLSELPQEDAPIAPPENPLNFAGSIEHRGFLGQVQKLIFNVGLGILAALIGDIIYRKQWWDGVTAVLAATIAILLIFPAGTAWWIGLIFFGLQLYLVWFAAFQGGRDYSPLAAYFLLVGTFGGLIASRIGAIQNIFVKMAVSVVPPIVNLGYNFQVMSFAGLAFPVIVYLFILIGFVVSVIESVRPGGEDRSSRTGSLISAGLGLLVFFIFLHGVHLAAWISFLIAFLVSAGGSAALRSEPAKQFVTPIFGVRSPFDGAMLLAATLLVLLVIFGQAWWLVGVL